jgi:hypothetical protein
VVFSVVIIGTFLHCFLLVAANNGTDDGGTLRFLLSLDLYGLSPNKSEDPESTFTLFTILVCL